MQKFYALNILLLFLAGSVYGQQEIHTSQFAINPFLLNPAYSSMDDNLDFKVGHRSQWVGIEGAPQTSYISAHSTAGKPHWGRTHPGDFHNWHGVGGMIVRDVLGPYANTRVNANYAYNIGITDGSKYGYEHVDGLRLALGTFIGWNSFSVDKDILGMSKTSGGSQIVNSGAMNDRSYNMLPTNSATTLDIGFGGLLYYAEKYFLGFSMTQILENEVELTQSSTLARHYFLTGSIKQQITDELYIIPSGIVKMVGGAPSSWNFTTRVDWWDKYYVGLGYRSGDAITGMIGLRYKWGEKIKHFRKDKHRYILQIYYSYDHTVSGLGERTLSENSQGSHEITLGFLIPPMFRERNAEDTW